MIYNFELARARCVPFLQFEFNRILFYNLTNFKSIVVFSYFFLYKTHSPTKKSKNLCLIGKIVTKLGSGPNF